jgi:hypothetical protein
LLADACRKAWLSNSPLSAALSGARPEGAKYSWMAAREVRGLLGKQRPRRRAVRAFDPLAIRSGTGDPVWKGKPSVGRRQRFRKPPSPQGPCGSEPHSFRNRAPPPGPTADPASRLSRKPSAIMEGRPARAQRGKFVVAGTTTNFPRGGRAAGWETGPGLTAATGFGCAIRLATEPALKPGELHGLAGPTPAASARWARARATTQPVKGAV